MIANEYSARVLERFESIRHRMRRAHLGALVGWTVLAALVGLACMAWLDYRFESGWNARAWRLAVLGAVLAAVVVRAAWGIVRRWSLPTTAMELEQRFPELGQRIRTTVQFGKGEEESIRREGATPSLVDALRQDTAEKTGPLALDAVVPVQRRRLAACTAGAALVLFAGALSDEEWHTAVRRTLLSTEPYTVLTVEPGDVTIDEGGHVDLTLTLTGRTGRTVTIDSRPAARPDAAWTSEEVAAAPGDADEAGRRAGRAAGNLPATQSAGLGGRAAPRSRYGRASYTARLRRIAEPLEYRVVAGPAESDTYRISVRYPLAIESVESEVEPPAYTGLSPKVTNDGNIAVLKGSRARIRVTLDREPASAHVRLAPSAVPDGKTPAPRTVPVRIEGRRVSFELDLEQDLRWSLIAASPDGTPLPENAWRVRVREDQPPRVTFAEPATELEVHTLAEVLMQVRASDDYGLARSGIVFQINNEEEHTLLEEDFAAAAEALAELEQGRVAPRTRAVLERMLPLEHFALTQRDCVAYYAFAEDNFPAGPHRTETDLRFIDIRPFRTIYRLSDMEPGTGGPQRDLVALEELIRRQRYALNRTIRLEKFPDRWGDGELNTVERLVQYQAELAEATRLLALFFEGEGTDGADVLYQAEGAMLAAVDSLSVARYPTAVLQEKDAQQFLVEARNRLEVSLNNNDDAAQRSTIRQFNRRLAQKLRRPRNDEESERQLVERLERLAVEQAEVCSACAGIAAGGGSSGEAAPSEEGEEGTGDGLPGEPSQNPREPAELAENDAGGIADEPRASEAESERGAADAGVRTAEAGQEDPAERRQELEDRQGDIVTEALEVQRLLEGLSGVTDLARERMRAAAEQADAVSGALARGEMTEAEESARDAADRFQELARHVAALLAGETARQVAMSRDLAAEIAHRNEQLADRLDEQRSSERNGRSHDLQSPDGGAERARESDPRSPADESRRLDESGRTLQDVMQSIARSDRADSVEAKDRVAELLQSPELNVALEQLRQLASGFADVPQPASGTVVQIREVSERMELTAVELDRLYRLIVAPRIEELKDLERRAALLEERLESLQTESEVAGWRASADALLDELQDHEIGGGAAEEAREMLRQLGAGSLASLGWSREAHGYFVAPRGHRTTVRMLVETLQQHIQELVLLDLLSAREEATPPGYEEFVERYLKVLAAGGEP